MDTGMDLTGFGNVNGDEERRPATTAGDPFEEANFDQKSIEKFVRAAASFGIHSLQFVPVGAILKAIVAVLKTEIAQVTMAQVVDGLPLAAVVRESRDNHFQDQNHPIYWHTTPSAEALAKASSLWELYKPSVWRYENDKQLRFDAELLQAFENAPTDSPAYATYLFEIVVAAIHQIAVSLFQARPQNQEADAMTSWTAPKENSTWWQHNRAGAPLTLLRHSQYTDYNHYPQGIADAVGYWAEDRIFGGVLLRDSNNYSKLNTIFLHPDRNNGPCRIFGLLNEQLMDLFRFLEKENRPPTSIKHSLDLILHSTLNPDFPTQPGALEALGLSQMASDLAGTNRVFRLMRESARLNQDNDNQIVPALSALQLSNAGGPSTIFSAAMPQPNTTCPFPILPSNKNPCRMNLSRPTNFVTCYREHWKEDEERLVYDFAKWISLKDFVFPKKNKSPDCSSTEHRSSSPGVHMEDTLFPSDFFDESQAIHQAEAYAP